MIVAGALDSGNRATMGRRAAATDAAQRLRRTMNYSRYELRTTDISTMVPTSPFRIQISAVRIPQPPPAVDFEMYISIDITPPIQPVLKSKRTRNQADEKPIPKCKQTAINSATPMS